MMVVENSNLSSLAEKNTSVTSNQNLKYHSPIILTILTAQVESINEETILLLKNYFPNLNFNDIEIQKKLRKIDPRMLKKKQLRIYL